MPQLPNAKHESFAYSVAKGMAQADAYVHAGYKDSPPSASRLAKLPIVAKRIAEIREEMQAAARAIVQAPTEANAQTMVELGIDLDWCVREFQDIAEKAKAAGQFAPANAAVKNIQGIVEIKSAKDPSGKTEEDSKYSLKEIGSIADMLSSLPEQPVMKDVTPAPAPKLISIEDIPEAPDDNT